jgi:hypothetical protein
MLLEMIASALVPALIDSGKQWVTTKLGGVKATTVDEQIKLDQNEVQKLQALAALDNPGGTPSQWVIDLRASIRYILAGVVIIGGVATLYVPVPPNVQTIALEAANIIFGFLFGSRIVSSFRK